MFESDDIAENSGIFIDNLNIKDKGLHQLR